MHVVKLTGLSKVSLFNYINVKNVFFGKYKGDEIVLKKLAHDSEFAEFDGRVCNGSARCTPRGRLFTRLLRGVFPDLSDGRSESLALAAGVGDRFLREHLTCPSQRLMRRLFDALADESKEKFLHFATMLLINAEPLLLQAFPQSEGWPFPRYLGACGRLVMEQYVGPTLANFRDSPWQQRVELALQLLEIADMLTTNDSDFNLYMTDVTADNLAVDADGRVHLVDVGRTWSSWTGNSWRKVDAPADWNKTHITPILCDDCMGYEADQLCGHHISDHNYFAICKGLLAPNAFGRGMSGGLLHSVPALVTSTHPELERWLRLCADPGPDGGSRFGPAAELRRTLNQVLEEASTE
ncbi:Deleted in autism protein 1 [Amphibalanus amphitrite]|uniref:Deleted in autism protein 1 n=1 Tax=Amphibalanus amphitrite TaxID=1232801 RepID=A0A6A4VLI7_AMPAM|nr:Deleted in autism protein 1 [Amphibalanus amphitrite]